MRKAAPEITGFVAVLLTLALTGCASVPPMPPGGVVEGRDVFRNGAGSAPGTKAKSPAQKPGATTITAVTDTVPSADALAVLGSIPEPLPAGERVPPPDVPANPPDGTTPEVSADTTGSQVPVPEPTYPLGLAPAPPPDTLYNAPRDTVVERASSAAPAEAASRTRPAPSGPPPGLVNPPSAQPATADTCWRIQVAAPPEKARAEQMRAAAESQLLVPMVIEFEAKRYKVRSKGCLDREGADRLKGRALASGFDGSFRFGTPRK